MKRSLLNYQFFKSYRLPLEEKDKVKGNIRSLGKPGRECLNVKIESLNLSGLNFISPMKFSVGEKVKIDIFTKRFINNWDFSLEGEIVRTFIYEKDTDKIVYGVLFSKQSTQSVLNYFLKDYIGRFARHKILEHLQKAATHSRKILSTEGVELYSLFNSITNDLHEKNVNDILKNLAKSFNSQLQFLFEYNENKNRLDLVSKTERNDIINTKLKGQLENSFHNEMLLNINSKSENKENSIYNIISYPIFNRNQRPVALLAIANTNSELPYNSFDESSLKLICGLLSYFYNDKYHVTKTIEHDHEHTYFNLLGHSKIATELRSSLDILKNNEKSIFVIGEQGTLKEEIAKYVHYKGINSNDAYHYIDFSNLDKINDFYETIDNFDHTNKGTIVINEVHLLSKVQQNRLFSFLKSHGSRVVVLSSYDINHYVTTGQFLKKLYYYISDINIHLTPLRNRKNDILELSNEILKSELRKRKLEETTFSKETASFILSYNWPKNLGQLANEIKKSILRYNGEGHIEIAQDKIKQSQQRCVSDKNSKLLNLLQTAVEHSDSSIHFNSHKESLNYYLRKNKVS